MTKLNLSFKYSLMFQFIKKEINDNLLSPLEKCKDNDNFITNLFVELPDCEKILSVLEKVVREILDDEIERLESVITALRQQQEEERC